MEEQSQVSKIQSHEDLASLMRKCLFSVLSVGPVPDHIGFIMDGNRRYAKRWNLGVGEGHKAGYWSFMSLLRYCLELEVKYVSFYAFSIDNFKRPVEEVQLLMNILQDKIEEMLEKKSYVNQFGVRVCFVGNLKLLSETVRFSAEKAMEATAKNSKAVLMIWFAYTSTDEIVHAVEESCIEKMNEIQDVNVSETYAQLPCNTSLNSEAALGTSSAALNAYSKGVENAKLRNGIVNHVDASNGFVPQLKLVDIEKHMYFAVAPDPDIVIRTSGETRLSNFLLWQTSNCQLEAPAALWPGLDLRHLVWAVLKFQRNHHYLEKKKKQV